jgi:hypothetical protein
MAVQGRTDQKNFPFFLAGSTLSRDAETLLQDAGRVIALAVYTLMARIACIVPTTGTADAGNTGDGTVTVVGLIAGTLPRVGTWVLECIVATAHGGTFKLTDPGGNIVRNDLVLAAGAGLATEFYIPEVGLKFTITDAGTDFASGDIFTIAITAGTKWVPFSADGINGSQIPRGIFIGDDVTAAALVAGDVVNQPIIVAGVGAAFDSSLLVIEGGATLDTVLANGQTVREALYALGFYAEETLDINVLEN